MTSPRTFWLCMFAASLGIFLFGATEMGWLSPDVAITHNDETIASCACGEMYATSHKCTLEDFETLVRRCTVVCSDPKGVEHNWRNPDGTLRHAVVIGSKESKLPGTPYDTCIVNWELSPAAAINAFVDVCIRRNF